ncbi:MAG: HAD family phosphatase [archaeon]
MIKAIIFDMGGVILTSKIENILQQVAKSLDVPAESLMEIRAQNKEALWDGKMSVRDFAALLKKKHSLKQSVAQILSIWKSTYLKATVPNTEMVAIAGKLMKMYKVGMISNLWDFHVTINKERGLYKGFDPCVLSCKVGIHKPQKKIFELALNKSGMKGDECVFIDDREEYFPIAQSLGMKTIAFCNASQMVVELKKLGVEV